MSGSLANNSSTGELFFASMAIDNSHERVFDPSTDFRCRWRIISAIERPIHRRSRDCVSMVAGKRLNLSLLALLTLTACAGTVSRSVSESDRDLQGRYDGQYRAVIDSAGGRQLFDGRWYSDCSPIQGSERFSVRDSELVWTDSLAAGERTFVGKEGQFRLEVDVESEAKGSNEMLSDGRRRTIIQGDLRESERVGFLVFGIRAFNYKGCTYKMRLEVM